MALADDIIAAREAVEYRQKRLADARREAKMYDFDSIDYPAGLVNATREAEDDLQKAERELVKLTGSKAGVGKFYVRDRDQLVNEIAREKARIKELETEITNNDRYQQTFDEYLIQRQEDYIDRHEKTLKRLERALKEVDKRKGNPTMAKKRKTKRKATPAQLRALARGRATAARNRKKKAPKRKKVARRRNPAYGNYQAARAVARGSRRVNPVRPLGAKMFFVMRGARYFTGYSFSQQKGLAVHYTSIGAAKAAAQKLANKTGTAIRIVDARK